MRLRELPLFWPRLLSFPIHPLWILFSSIPTLVDDKWVFLWRSYSLLFVVIIHCQSTRTQSPHLTYTYSFNYLLLASYDAFFFYYIVVMCPCYVRLSTIYIGLVELLSIRLTWTDFDSVLFTLKEWGELYLQLLSKLVNYWVLPMKTTSHIYRNLDYS